MKMIYLLKAFRPNNHKTFKNIAYCNFCPSGSVRTTKGFWAYTVFGTIHRTLNTGTSCCQA